MKYIIDVPNDTKWIEAYYTLDHLQYQGKAIMVDSLTPYTEPDRKDIENEVWDFVGAISELSFNEHHKCFDIDYNENVCHKYTYQEAKDKYEAWKKQEDEVHVGDEVETLNMKGIVTWMGKTSCSVMWDDGRPSTEFQKELRKTGRHFDDIEELLKKIKEN